MNRLLLLPLLGLATLATAPGAWAQAPAHPKLKGPTPTTQFPAGPASAPAAGAATAEIRANALTANMQQNLGLSPKQVEQVGAINQRSVAAVESARAHYRTDPRKLQGIIDGVGQSRLEALKDVLTPAQFDKYQRKREEKMGLPNVQGVQGTPPPGLGGGE